MTASKANIENIIGAMTIIAQKVALGKAELTQCQRSVSGRSKAICIAPNPIELEYIPTFSKRLCKDI